MIVTKVGARRREDESWIPALWRQELIDRVHDNGKNLVLDTLDVVNLRVGAVMEPSEGSIEGANRKCALSSALFRRVDMTIANWF